MSVNLVRLEDLTRGFLPSMREGLSSAPAPAAAQTQAQTKKSQVYLNNNYTETVFMQHVVRVSELRYKKSLSTLEKDWGSIVELEDLSLTDKVMLFLCPVFGEAGNVWGRILNLYDEILDVDLQATCKELIFHIKRYPGVPEPTDAQKKRLDAITGWCTSYTEELEDWQDVDFSLTDFIAKKLTYNARFLSDEVLNYIWKEVQFNEMNEDKIWLLFHLLLCLPPRFWKGREKELQALGPKLIPFRDSVEIVGFLINIIYCKRPLEGSTSKLNPHQQILENIKKINSVFYNKAVFNLLWADPQKLKIDFVMDLMDVIYCPIDLQQVAAFINENAVSWNEETFRKVVRHALLTSEASLHLSDAVIHRYYGDHRFQGFRSSDLTQVISQWAILKKNWQQVENSKRNKKERVQILEDLAIFLRWFRAWMPHDAYKDLTEYPEEILKMAASLRILYYNDPYQRKISQAFDKIAKFHLSADQLSLFNIYALSLSHNKSGVKFNEHGSIVYQMLLEIENGDEWFRDNRELFVKTIRDESFFKVCGIHNLWDNLIPLYQKYKAFDPKGSKWIIEAVVAYVNANETAKSPNFLSAAWPTIEAIDCTLADFKNAVKADRHLLQLIEKVVNSDKIIKASTAPQLAEWGAKILRAEGGDEEFWEKVQGLLKSVQKEVRSQKKGKQSPLPELWKNFDKKIADAATPAEALKFMIAERRNETLQQFIQKVSGAMSELSILEQKYQKKQEKIDVEPSEDSIRNDFNLEKLKELGQIPEKLGSEQRRVLDCFGRQIAAVNNQFDSLPPITKASVLQEKLNHLVANELKKLQGLFESFKLELDTIDATYKENVSALKKKRDFRYKQATLLGQSASGAGTNKYRWLLEQQEKRVAELWAKRTNLLKLAQNVEEMDRIVSDFEREKLESERDLAKKLEKASREKLVTSTETAGRIKFLEEKRKKDKAEKEALKKEIEQLRNEALRPSVPHEKEKEPANEPKPSLEGLIELLHKKKSHAQKAEKALKMLEGKGKLLNTPDELEKFMKIFDCQVERTRGSHERITNGKEGLTLASHESKSSKAEKESTLRTAYEVASNW